MNFTSFSTWLNESYVSGSVWRSTDQRWLQYLLDQDKTLDIEKYYKQLNPSRNHSGKFISLSFDSDSGGQDSFGGKEIVIEFDEKLIFEQDAIEVEYDSWWFDDHSDICVYVTGFKDEKDYYENKGYESADDANANGELSWDQYIECYEHEREIVMKKIKYVPGLIKTVKFFVKPNEILIEMLNENNIKYELHTV